MVRHFEPKAERVDGLRVLARVRLQHACHEALQGPGSHATLSGCSRALEDMVLGLGPHPKTLSSQQRAVCSRMPRT